MEPASIREQSSPRFAYETHSDVRSENVDWDEQNRSTDNVERQTGREPILLDRRAGTTISVELQGIGAQAIARRAHNIRISGLTYIIIGQDETTTTQSYGTIIPNTSNTKAAES